MKKKKGTGIKLWGILTPVLAILTVAAIIGASFAMSASQAINIFLKVDTYKVGGGGEAVNYFETGFSSAEELEAHDKEAAEQLTGEGAELEYGAYANGTNYLALCQDELDMLKMASDNFDKVIVIINAANAIEMDFWDSPDFDVDAVLWVGYTGTWGLNAVADILAGSVNPSGHLVGTFCYGNTFLLSMAPPIDYCGAIFPSFFSRN